MIRHIVFFNVTDPSRLDAVVEGLSILKDIPHADRLEVVRNTKVDPWSDEVDIVVYGEFRDQEALAAYKAHPRYSESVARVRPLREMRISADIDVGNPNV